MSLKINTSVKSKGRELLSSFARVDPTLEITGTTIGAKVKFYDSELTFNEDINNNIQITGLTSGFKFAYNRIVDGVDLLDLASKKAKEIFVSELGCDESKIVIEI